MLEKAQVACNNSAQDITLHWLPDIRKPKSGKGQVQEIEDFRLTRYACYLTAQTRRMENIQRRILENKRLEARGKLKETEYKLSGVVFHRGVKDIGFGRMRSKGDKELFGGYDTSAMKQRLGIKNNNKPIADVLPTVSLKAKDLATEITCMNVETKDIRGENEVIAEHVTSNKHVRQALVDSNI